MIPTPTLSMPTTKSSIAIGMAREVLANARAELDVAVAALPPMAGNEAIATPHLVLLLARAVKARQRLAMLEALPVYVA